MSFETVLEAKTPSPSSDLSQIWTRAKIEPTRDWSVADATQTKLGSSPPKQLDAETVRRFHSEDPFFRARADRYALLDDLVRAQESTAEAATTSRKYIEMLKKRRDMILLELVDLIAEKSQTKTDTLWKATPAPSRSTPVSNKPNTRSWHWP